MERSQLISSNLWTEWSPESVLALWIAIAAILIVLCVAFGIYRCFCKKQPLQDQPEILYQARCESAVEEGSEVNLTCTPVLPPGKINTFITKEVVPELYQQRNSADGQQQFAVLFLGNKDDDEYKLKLGNLCNGDKFTDSTVSSYPDDKNLGNYIVARPDTKEVHAEKLLLNQFDALQDTYKGENKCLPSFILIFSWRMPCGACTSDIIKLKKKFQGMSKEFKIVVVYKTDYDSGQDSRNQKKLRNANITLFQDKNYYDI